MQGAAHTSSNYTHTILNKRKIQYLSSGLVGDLLGLLDSLGGVLSGLDGGIALSLTELGLLVSLGEDGLKSGVSNGAGSSGDLLVSASLLRVLLTVDSLQDIPINMEKLQELKKNKKTNLLVLASVKDGPGDVTGVSLQLV